jgi:hypothetical protein
MKRAVVFSAMTVGSWVAFWLGNQVGFATACIASVIGMGVGLYAGRRICQRYEEYL